MIGAPCGDEQIRIAVVIVVARANAFRPGIEGLRQPYFGRDIGEAVVPFVMVQAVISARPGEQEDVEQPIVVVIDECRAAAGGFDDEPFRLRAAVRKRLRQACLFRDVAEIDLVDGSRQRKSYEDDAGDRLHCFGAFSPSFFRKSANSPSGGFCSLSNSAFSRAASWDLPVSRYAIISA